MKWYWYLLLCSAGIAIFLLWPVSSPLPISIKVARQNLRVDVPAGGKLYASKSTTITCPLRRDTEIISIVPEGSLVKKGDVVLEFNDAQLSYQVKENELRLKTREMEQREAEALFAAEKEKMLAQIESFKVDVAIADLDLQEKKNQPTPDELELAEKEYQHAQIVMTMARQEYKRITQDAKLTLIDEELYALEKSLQDATSAYRKAELEYALVASGAHPYVIEKIAVEKKKKLLELQEVEKAMPDKMRQLQSQVDQAITRVKQARNQLDKAREEWQKTKVKAPSDGLVVYCVRWGTKIAVGQKYWMGIPLLDIPDLSVMEMRSKVLERQIGLVKKGQQVTVMVDSIPGKQFDGKVTKIGKVAVDTSENEVVGFFDSKNKTGIKVFEVTIRLEAIDSLLLPQMTAIAKIHVQELKQVLVLPKFAVFSKDNQYWVWIAEGGKLAKRDVVVGASNEIGIVIEKGLRENEQVYLLRE